MDDKNELRIQVRQVIIETNGSLPNNEIYNRFVNECNDLKLSEDDFYLNILKPAYKSINWEEETAKAKALQEEQKRKEDEQRAKEEEQQKKEAEKKAIADSANAFTERLIETTFAKGIIKAEDLQKIFKKAAEGQQDKFALATLINKQLEAKNYRPYPPASFDAPDLKELLISTDWYNTQNYPKAKPSLSLQEINQIATQKLPEPQTKKTNWGLIILVIALVIAIPYFIFRNTKSDDTRASESATDTTSITPSDTAVSVPDNTQKKVPGNSSKADTTTKPLAKIPDQADPMPVTTDTTTTSYGITDGERQDIYQKLNAFYEAENNQEIPTILANFSFPVRYYNFPSVYYEDLKKIYETSFYTKLKSHRITIDWQSSRVQKTSYGYHLTLKATYDFILTKHPDDPVTRNINIVILLNPQMRITTIYEN